MRTDLKLLNREKVALSKCVAETDGLRQDTFKVACCVVLHVLLLHVLLLNLQLLHILCCIHVFDRIVMFFL